MTATRQSSRTLCVVVPIYNAVAQLAACLASLDRTLDADDHVLLADDASPNPAIPALLEAFAQRCRATVQIVRRAKNLGFVGNVNAAMAEAGEADVVLLNSDTVTTQGWLQRMADCAAADPRIATITPWSNNAEICSFPDLCRAAPAPTPEQAERIAAAAASLVDCPPPELPTAVGFAMYIRRAALRALGDFDQATFGRGYGEENDFCRRAAAHGWRNVLCPTAYVAHVGHASFAELDLRPGGDNLARLVARYPDYNARVAEFIAADPLQAVRERLRSALAGP